MQLRIGSGVVSIFFALIELNIINLFFQVVLQLPDQSVFSL